MGFSMRFNRFWVVCCGLRIAALDAFVLRLTFVSPAAGGWGEGEATMAAIQVTIERGKGKSGV